MARIKCDYFDKYNNPMTSKGDLMLSISDFAHALLFLYGKFGSPLACATRYQSCLLQVISDFYPNQYGNWVMNVLPSDAYDGIKKMSDVYGAAITIAVAVIKYGYTHFVPLTKSIVISPSGTWPDFYATDGYQHGLFESKASLTYVTKSAKAKGIKQLMRVASVNNGSATIRHFSHRILVATSLRNIIKRARCQGVHCSILDPDNLENQEISFSLFRALQDYYRLVEELMSHGERIDFGESYEELADVSELRLGGVRLHLGIDRSIRQIQWDAANLKEIEECVFGRDHKYIRTQNGFYPDGVFLRVMLDFQEE